MLDWKIAGGTLLDGTGAPARRADVGVTGDRITDIGDLSRAEARCVTDAAGRMVCPGFIDAHSHSDTYLLIEPSAPSKIFQGITTEVVGNCGASAAPLADWSYLPADWGDKSYPARWRTFAEYVALLEQARPAPNVVLLVGHGKLRSWAMGYAARPAQPDEIRQMLDLLEQCLDAGGSGMSTGLIYAPGKFALHEEIVELARVVARHDGVYTSHIRNEGRRLLEAVAEAIAVGRASGARVEISHLKTSGKDNWPLADAALDAIRRARADGIGVAADRYPYLAGCTDLDILLPDWAASGGREAILRRLRDPAQSARIRDEIAAAHPAADWADVIVGSTGATRFQGRPLPAVAAALGMDPPAAALKLIEADELRTSGFFFGMSEANMWKILAEPYVMLGTDASLRSSSGPLGADYPHPRAYGTCVRFLRAALDGQTVALPEAIRKMTSLPAEHFGLKGRGVLDVGRMADLVVFNPDTVCDLATYAAPHQLARGIELVMVNGVPVLGANGLTGRRNGRILRRL